MKMILSKLEKPYEGSSLARIAVELGTHIQQLDFLPNLYPGQPWLTLVTLDQSQPWSALVSPGPEQPKSARAGQGRALVQGNQSQPGLARVELWSRVTKVSQGWPWSALVQG